MSNDTNHYRFHLTHLRLLLVLTFVSVVFWGCAPSGYAVKKEPVDTPPPLPTTTVYFYPTRDQSEEQQDRDRYECYLWAVKQSGFDPGQAQLAPHQRIEVKPVTPPGADTAAGAVSGAIIGSIVAPHRDSSFGLVFGAITGAMIGAASDAARQEEAERIQRQYDAKEAQRYARLEKQARDYQRAMTACLEGRGYAVR
ncbi:hypothetical protein [Kaarinaea lacus]